MLGVAINGFGRIGRMFLRSFLESTDLYSITIVAISDICNLRTLLHLLEYDSIHGKLGLDVSISDDHVKIGKNMIKLIDARHEVSWEKLGVDLVLDASGTIKKKEQAIKHLQNGAKRVLVSTIVQDADLNVVYGVNHTDINKNHKIISNASCTSNCVVSLIYALQYIIDIECGHATSIHSYTNGQTLIDSYHPDIRRSRSTYNAIIPTTTNASLAIEALFPNLKDKILCTSYRVPVSNVSLIDFDFVSRNEIDAGTINEYFINISMNKLKGVLSYSDKPLVSVDFIHNKFSAIVDLLQTEVIDKKLCRVSAWYDNEWGYANRMLDLLKYINNAGV